MNEAIFMTFYISFQKTRERSHKNKPRYDQLLNLKVV